MNPAIAPVPDRTRARNVVTWSFIGGMFFLRIILAGVVVTFVQDSAVWVYPICSIGTYLLTALLIWWERDWLGEFFIDKPALTILILGKPYELLLHWLEIPFRYPPETGWYLLYLPIAFGMLTVVLLARPKLSALQARNWHWLLIGVIVGFLIGVAFGFLLKLQTTESAGKLTPQLLFFVPTQQLVFAGVVEEPFFRGFLWGGLRRAGWKDGWVLVFQAALFMVGHLYYAVSHPLAFWVIVPGGGLVTGLLAWKSRSIATSMTAHGFINGIGKLVAFYHL